mgnify:CR=1 FL=1
MRVATVSDLHLDHAANRELMPALAAEVHRRGADLVVIAGDVSHRDAWIERAIRSFLVVAPEVAYLPGNHDLWQHPDALARGADTWTRYRRDLRALTTELGARYLPDAPWRRGPVAIVGTCGWYDYGFLDAAHRELMTDERRQTKRLDRFQWSDARFVRFYGEDGRVMSDVEVLDVMIRDLERQLLELQDDPEVERIMVATHHLPFEELIFRTGTLPWEFFNAFMGSPRLGEVLLRYPKVTSVLYGHTHRGRSVSVAGRRVEGTPLGYPRERPGLSTDEIVASRIGWWEL